MPFKFTTQGDRFGWLRGHDGRWHLTLRIESGRVVDRPARRSSRASRRSRPIHQGDFRLTANQNLIIANVPASECMNIDQLVADHGLGKRAVHIAGAPRRAGLRGAAHLRAGHGRSRALSTALRRSRRRAARRSMDCRDIPLTVRITGCPERLRAAVSRGDRAHRPRSRPLHAAPRRRCRRLATERAVSRQHRRERPSSPRSMSSSAATRAERHTDERFGDFLWRAQRAQAGDARVIEAVARTPQVQQHAGVAGGCAAPDAHARGVRRRCRGCQRRINDWLASVDAATRVRWALEESAGSVRAVVELRRAGRRVAAPGRAGGSRYPGAADRHGLSIPRDLPVHQAARAAALAQHPDVLEPAVRSTSSRRSTASSGSRAAKGSTSISSCARWSPCAAALATLGTATWFAGLRRSQAASRAALNPLEVRDGRFKVHPIFDWSDRDVYLYLKAHGLPYHPLWDKGYVSIGDWHSTKALHEVESADRTALLGTQARVRNPRPGRLRSRAAARVSRATPMTGRTAKRDAAWLEPARTAHSMARVLLPLP